VEAEAEVLLAAAATAAATPKALPMPLVAFSGAIPASLPRAGWVAAMRASSSEISEASASALRGFLLEPLGPDGGAPGAARRRCLFDVEGDIENRAVAMCFSFFQSACLGWNCPCLLLFDSPRISRQDD